MLWWWGTVHVIDLTNTLTKLQAAVSTAIIALLTSAAHDAQPKFGQSTLFWRYTVLYPSQDVQISSYIVWPTCCIECWNRVAGSAEFNSTASIMRSPSCGGLVISDRRMLLRERGCYRRLGNHWEAGGIVQLWPWWIWRSGPKGTSTGSLLANSLPFSSHWPVRCLGALILFDLWESS